MTHLTSDAETLLSSEHSPHGNYDPGKTVRNGTHIQNERFPSPMIAIFTHSHSSLHQEDEFSICQDASSTLAFHLELRLLVLGNSFLF